MNNLLISRVGTTILSIVLAVIILLVMICVHEFGHFVAGRILGFKIDEFAIGFGPRIFKRRGKKHGTLFSVRAFPLGGFCAFEGEDGDEGTAEESAGDGTAEANGVTDPVPVLGDGMAVDVRANGVTANQVKTEQIMTEAVKSPSPTAFNSKKPWQRIIVLVAGAMMNYLLALLLIIVMFFAFGQACYKMGAMDVASDYPVEYSLQEGDVILNAGGRSVYFSTDLISALGGKEAGEEVTFTVLRDGQRVTTQVILRSDCNFKNSSEVSKIWRALGSGTYETEDGKYWTVTAENIRLPFFQTLGRSFVYSFKTAGAIFRVLGELLTGNLGLNAVGGPVTTIKLTGEMAVQGFESFLQIASYIGVNLAVFNLLPIPALDGSKVIFCLIEWIFKKPVPRKVEAIIHAVGFVLILGFAVIVDILQFARC